MKTTMPGAFRASPYWHRYRKAFGKDALRIYATFHFQEWLDHNHPCLPREVEPPVLGPGAMRHLARAAILAGRKQEDLFLLLIAGQIERRWRIAGCIETLAVQRWADLQPRT